MKLTTKGRYAVTAMLDLAIHHDKDGDNCAPVNLADIAQRQEISLTYLEQLFGKLRKNQLVESSRGPGGGYKLARSADNISIAQVVSAVDENVDATKCGGEQNCHGESQCLTHDLWHELSHQISTFLDGISLGDLVERNQHKLDRMQEQPITFESNQQL